MPGRAPRALEIPLRAGRRRRVGYRVCLALFALFWLTAGFGVIDLASGFASRSTDRTEVLSAPTA